MKTWKLVSGILSIILSLLVLLQSCAAGFANSVSRNGEVSGTGGMLVAIILLAGGIVSVSTKKGSKGGDIALIVLFGLGTVIAFSTAGTLYKDLYVWGVWNAVCVVLALISLKKQKEVVEVEVYEQPYRRPQSPYPNYNANYDPYYNPNYNPNMQSNYDPNYPQQNPPRQMQSPYGQYQNPQSPYPYDPYAQPQQPSYPQQLPSDPYYDANDSYYDPSYPQDPRGNYDPRNQR